MAPTEGGMPESLVLPQRQPRQKRRRTMDQDAPAEGAELASPGGDAPQPAAPAADGDAPAAGSGAAGGGEAAEPRGAPVDAAEAALDLPAYRSGVVEGQEFEYLDHTADVQLHAWGATLEDAFASVGLAMFNYMTPLEGIAVDESLTRTYEAKGHDLSSLLFNFLDELLFVFSTELFVAKELRVTALDRQGFTLTAEGRGESFDRQRHTAGTEVKAITYSAMQILERPGDAEVFVIVDI